VIVIGIVGIIRFFSFFINIISRNIMVRSISININIK